MDASEATRAVLQILTGAGLLIGVLVSLSTLTVKERTRRKAKTNVEIWSALPDSPEKEDMWHVVSMSVHDLTSLENPDSYVDFRKWSGRTTFALYTAVVLLGLMGVGFVFNDQTSATAWAVFAAISLADLTLLFIGGWKVNEAFENTEMATWADPPIGRRRGTTA